MPVTLSDRLILLSFSPYFPQSQHTNEKYAIAQAEKTLLKIMLLPRLFAALVLMCLLITVQAADNFTPTSDFTDNGDGTVTHKLTGLTWKRCAEGQNWSSSISSCVGMTSYYTWDAAKLIHSNFAGKNDWRLPSPWELTTIVDYDNSSRVINTDIFGYDVNYYFWSSSPDAGNLSAAVIVSFNFGYLLSVPKSNVNVVRLVRGGQPWGTTTTPASYFTDNNDGTVTHNLTGLTWMRCAIGQNWKNLTCDGTARPYTFDNAKTLTSSIFAGHSDWRIPNIQELQSIVEYGTSNPAINTSIFPNTPASVPFWTSTLTAYNPNTIWVVSTSDGIASGGDGGSLRSYVRLVRGGRSSSNIEETSKPDLVVTQITANNTTPSFTTPGTTSSYYLAVQASVQNQGSVSSQPTKLSFFLTRSDNQIIDLGFSCDIPVLLPGELSGCSSSSHAVPSDAEWGIWSVGALIDSLTNTNDSDTNNNVFISDNTVAFMPVHQNICSDAIQLGDPILGDPKGYGLRPLWPLDTTERSDVMQGGMVLRWYQLVQEDWCAPVPSASIEYSVNGTTKKLVTDENGLIGIQTDWITEAPLNAATINRDIVINKVGGYTIAPMTTLHFPIRIAPRTLSQEFLISLGADLSSSIGPTVRIGAKLGKVGFKARASFLEASVGLGATFGYKLAYESRGYDDYGSIREDGRLFYYPYHMGSDNLDQLTDFKYSSFGGWNGHTGIKTGMGVGNKGVWIGTEAGGELSYSSSSTTEYKNETLFFGNHDGACAFSSLFSPIPCTDDLTRYRSTIDSVETVAGDFQFGVGMRMGENYNLQTGDDLKSLVFGGVSGSLLSSWKSSDQYKNLSYVGNKLSASLATSYGGSVSSSAFPSIASGGELSISGTGTLTIGTISEYEITYDKLGRATRVKRKQSGVDATAYGGGLGVNVPFTSPKGWSFGILGNGSSETTQEAAVYVFTTSASDAASHHPMPRTWGWVSHDEMYNKWVASTVNKENQFTTPPGYFREFMRNEKGEIEAGFEIGAGVSFSGTGKLQVEASTKDVTTVGRILDIPNKTERFAATLEYYQDDSFLMERKKSLTSVLAPIKQAIQENISAAVDTYTVNVISTVIYIGEGTRVVADNGTSLISQVFIGIEKLGGSRKRVSNTVLRALALPRGALTSQGSEGLFGALRFLSVRAISGNDATIFPSKLILSIENIRSELEKAGLININPNNVGIYYTDSASGLIQRLESSWDANTDTISAAVDRRGAYSLGYDTQKPTINSLAIQDSGTVVTLTAKVNTDLSGINKQTLSLIGSNQSNIISGQDISTFFDAAAGIVNLSIDHSRLSGLSSLSLYLSDNAGNSTQKTICIYQSDGRWVSTGSINGACTTLGYELSITKNGLGVGTVLSSPIGINCGNTCKYDFAASSSVSITAVPAAGYVFDRWSGACQGNATMCSITIDGIKNVTAYFSPLPQSNLECLFNWAERNYQELFTPSPLTTSTYGPYEYKYYSATNSYLGTSQNDQHLYYLGPLSNNEIIDVGPLATWLSTSNCANSLNL